MLVAILPYLAMSLAGVIPHRHHGTASPVSTVPGVTTPAQGTDDCPICHWQSTASSCLLPTPPFEGVTPHAVALVLVPLTLPAAAPLTGGSPRAPPAG